MSTWQQIRDLTVQRLAEYQGGAAEGATGASLNQATIYFRIGRAFKRMLDQVAAHAPDKVTSIKTFTYANQAESVNLPAELIARDVFSLERLATATDYEPIEPMTAWQEQQARIQSQWLVAVDTPVQSTYGYRIEGLLIYIYPKPTGDLTLRARYFAATADLSEADAAGVPTVIPDEFHDLIALVAARSIKGETAANPELQEEYLERWREYTSWASIRPKRTSQRFVHERD